MSTARTPFGRLARDLAVYGTGRVGFQVLLFASVPILTRVFTPAEYGVIETILPLTAGIAVISQLGLDSASQRSYFDYAPEQIAERRAVLSTTFWTLLVWSSLIAICFVALSGYLSEALFDSRQYRTVLAFAGALIVTENILYFFQEVLRVRHRPVQYSVVSILAAVAMLGTMLVLVAVLDQGLEGYYQGLALGGLAGIAVAYALARDSIARVFDRRELRVMLAFGLPLVPVAASNWALQLLNRPLLLEFSSLRELGLYGVGARLANVLMLAVLTLGLAWSPLIFDLHRRDPDEERRVRARSLTYTTVLLCFGAIVVSVYARELFSTVTDPSFVDAYKVVGLLSGAVVMIGLNAVTMTGFALTRQTQYLARYALYVTPLYIVLNLALIPGGGNVGAALATFLTYAVLTLLYYRRAQLLDPVPYRPDRVLITLVIAAALIGAGTAITIDPLWLSALVKAPLVLAFPVLMVALRVLDAEALDLVRRLRRGARLNQ